jgi:hypothetical protein
VLPLKYLDFVESPVPLLTGIVVNSEDADLSPEALLARCDDEHCRGISAVLDTNTCEIYMVCMHSM